MNYSHDNWSAILAHIGNDRDYTWNDNGELIRISSPRQTRSYSYSTTGRLTGVHTTAANLDIRIPYATIRHVFTLCCAFRRILSACNRCIFLTKKAAEFHPCGLIRAQIAITAA
nr:hypothetical protein [Escherichia coli]